MNNTDGNALVARSRFKKNLCCFTRSHINIFRCYNLLGHNKEAIEDAVNAANINGDNYAAREALAVAFYADGQFELALAHFHRVFRSINISIYFYLFQ